MEQEFLNVDNDGLNPPEGSFPEPVDGAVAYKWDPVNKVWVPIFEE
jgi:hypothetical protein